MGKYEDGYKMALVNINQSLLRDMRSNGIKTDGQENIYERQLTIEKLRELSEALGCNDWPDELFIPDIIEKHIMRSDLIRDLL
jgi:hypothetical protein